MLSVAFLATNRAITASTKGRTTQAPTARTSAPMAVPSVVEATWGNGLGERSGSGRGAATAKAEGEEEAAAPAEAVTV